MFFVALVLYGLAFLCFFAVAGNVTARVNLTGLGLACCALLWFLQVLVPAVPK